MPAHSVKYLEATLSNEQVAERIKLCIKNQTPFCLSRMGDGEIYILNDNAPDSLKQRIANLWGYHVSEYPKMRQKYVEQLLTTIRETDILGIMDFNNVENINRKFYKHIWSLPISKLNKLNVPEPVCCDHKLPRSKLFGDPNNFKHIICGEPINIITPNKSLDIDKLSNILQTNVSVTLIDNDREKLINKTRDIKENVVLYGVSITAKDLGVILKKQNKIAIDFGATLDAWAGIQSRPWFKDGNIQEYCVIK